MFNFVPKKYNFLSKMTKLRSFLTMSNRLNRFGYFRLRLTFEWRWRRDRSIDYSRPATFELEKNVKFIRFNPINHTSFIIAFLSDKVVNRREMLPHCTFRVANSHLLIPFKPFRYILLFCFR